MKERILLCSLAHIAFLLPQGITIRVEWWLGIDSEEKLKMSCYVMLEFTAKPGTDPAALEALRVSLAESRTKDGCESIELTVNQDDSNNMLLVMRWASRRHYQAYRDWREANGDVKRFADATVNGLSTRFFDIIDA